MKLSFYLRFYTHPGQEIWVTGTVPEFNQPTGADSGLKGIPLQYMDGQFWQGTLELLSVPQTPLKYNYLLRKQDGSWIQEWGDDREIRFDGKTPAELQLTDTWNPAGEYENAFYTAPFQQILLPEHKKKTVKQPKGFTHTFRVKAPLLSENETLALSGSGFALSDWSETEPIAMGLEGNWWTASVTIPREDFPVSYKYGVFDRKKKILIRFEEGANRWLPGSDPTQKRFIIHDGFAHLPNNTWRGAGVSIPVFSLRSKKSFGTGEFTDLKLLADWAKKTGLKLIQLLPVNDTTATGTYLDSYPYAAVSAFALHPLYLNLETVAGKKNASLLKPLKKIQKELNALPGLDYETVISHKIAVLRELFAVQKDALAEDAGYLAFFEANKHWLTPYAAFCSLRDSNGTADFSKWKTYGKYNRLTIDRLAAPASKQYEQIQFYYYVQYHLHLQLEAAAEYAHSLGVVIKGDIAIGVYRHSCDAWTSPELFHMHEQAGAPPDPFAKTGQNWGFPTYNWPRMAEDNYKWWKQRFEQMSVYFDAFRIDHILGFFRIWSIPVSAVEGILGRFEPSIPVYRVEFDERNIWFDLNRYTLPFVNDAVLWEYFGSDAEQAKNDYFDAGENGNYLVKEPFGTQRKIVAWFAEKPEDEYSVKSQAALMAILSNVILFNVKGKEGAEFHFRFAMEETSSFRYLDYHLQQQLKDLYINYFFRRQDAFWKKEALKKLPALKRSTNMLICGEDLGMVPPPVPEVMNELGILSLEIQRMPKDQTKLFFHPADSPYLAVVTPSTHDMSTIRGWWEEDRALTQRFFNEQLGQWGEAPYFCESWINKAILQQHLHSPAMWSIFQLQDILGISDALRRESPADERINVPADPKHFWKYRMHLELEDLLKQKEFNNEWKDMVETAAR